MQSNFITCLSLYSNWFRVCRTQHLPKYQMQGSFEIILESSFCREGTLLLLIKRHFQEPIWKEQGKILDLIDNFIENNLQMKSWNCPKLPFNLSLFSISFIFFLLSDFYSFCNSIIQSIFSSLTIFLIPQ